MEGDDGAGSLPTQKTGLGIKGGGRPAAKSSGLQRSWSSQTRPSKDPGEPVITARKSSTKTDGIVQSVLRGQDTRSSHEPHAEGDDRSRQVNAVTGFIDTRMQIRGGASPLQQSNVAGKMAPLDASQNRNRMKNSTGNIIVERARPNQPENFARKSGSQESTSSRDVIASPQSLTRVKGSHAPFESARPFLSYTNAVAGPSNYSRNEFRRTERPTIDLTKNPDSSQYRSSLALPSPFVNRNQPRQPHVELLLNSSSTSKQLMDSEQIQSHGEIPWPRRRLSVITSSEFVMRSVKSRSMKPHWQLDDEGRAKEQQNMARMDHPDRDYIKRIGPGRRTAPTSQPHHFKDAPKHSRGYLGRNFTLKKQGEPDSESDYDSPMEIDEQSLPPRRATRLQQTGVKAARKREWPQPLPFNPDSSDGDEPVTSSDEVDELNSSDSSSSEEGIHHSDIEEIVITARRQRSLSPAEIEILPGPPRPPSPLAIPEGMMKAINALSLALVRMQSTKQLPFLRRNLRCGFTKRCHQLGVPTESALEQGTRLRVQYEYRSKIVTVRLHDWACPLCELHGFFPTREMLACHLSWDHDEAPAAWKRYRSGVWYMRLMVTDPLIGFAEDNEHGVSPTEQLFNVITPLPTPRRQQQQQDISSPFPFVTLSPPELQSVSASSSARARAQDLSSPLANVRDSPTSFTSTSRDSHSMMTPFTVPLSSHGRSTTTATTVTPSARRPRDPRYPTPPPPSNPLGPAAQPPYLPAKSEYGGPDIYYSCRPGGECLFDLLNTLPLEPYGVLSWDVLDREDEIYDSDNVKDEYKVMHALWGRWIVLNRKTFIKNYFKGTKAFIDYYWRMIHRAAGWDALRYWLLMLVVNRFITGADVASLLKHYESLTGMDTWYD
ncbi:hypothetical protein J132_11236 [Termitomyces sp. J132]|nr:hypothetical protein C0989_006925 [Termitomyces sp. Mn162]KNZ81603.1 hypothetical protein J132_11236 [Termitomyces sp. J132]